MRKGTLRTLAGLCALSFIVSGLLAFTPLYTHEEESVFRDRQGKPLPLRINRLTGERWFQDNDLRWYPQIGRCGFTLLNDSPDEAN